MTLVVGRKFDSRVVLLADTMISDPRKCSPDLIPGQLKIVVIHAGLSIGLAGGWPIGVDAVRASHRACAQGAPQDAVLTILRDASVAGESPEQCPDFLVAVHDHGGAALRKITGGSISTDQAVHWIGDPSALALVSPPDGVAPAIRQHGEEDAFVASFSRALLTNLRLRPTVGGFATCLLASPQGHCYQSLTGLYAPGEVEWTDELPAAGGWQDVPLPDDHFTYDFIAPERRGVGVAGVYLRQLARGYVYEPLNDDRPSMFDRIDRDAFCLELAARARAA